MGGLFSAPTVQTIAAKPEEAPSIEAPNEAGVVSGTEATLEEFIDEDSAQKKRRAKTKGAKSLQIPLGGSGGSGSLGTI